MRTNVDGARASTSSVYMRRACRMVYILHARADRQRGVETISARVYGMHVPRWILLAYKS